MSDNKTTQAVVNMPEVAAAMRDVLEHHGMDGSVAEKTMLAIAKKYQRMDDLIQKMAAYPKDKIPQDVNTMDILEFMSEAVEINEFDPLNN